VVRDKGMGALMTDREERVEEGRLAVDREAGFSPGSFRVLLAAGGTGGHIFPALSVAQELRARHAGETGGGLEIEFLGTGRGLEARLVPAAGFRLRTIAAAGLKGIGGVKRLVNMLVLPKSVYETASTLREFQPDVVVGVGGYLAGPVVLEAALKDIPTLLIEPNAVPGFTNRILAPLVRLAAVGFEDAARFYGSKARVTGHPIRRAFFSVPPKAHSSPFTVLVVGGSQGSKGINRCMPEAMRLLPREMVKVVHQTGERDYNAVEGAYRDRGIATEVCAFIEDVPGALARADLVVARSGASTVAEITAAGKAAVLIPFPHATDQHQLHNARALERAGAARVIEEQNLTPPRLAEEIRSLLESLERLTAMECAARAFSKPGAAERIADLIEELAR
jgi:UDP-N-acetylglucosamine--N-acetylmuramyl-(pentapeptide) pyrophosphoryl-undecaprenol N-acetylglucosamine transferase